LSSEIFNIGGDETWDLGKGRSQDLVKTHGYGQVYSEFLSQIMQAANAQGKTPAFWADIVLNHPESADVLDHDAIALDWGYSGSHDFRSSQEVLTQAGFHRRWVCPGTNCWSTWGGHSDERRSNLFRAVEHGLATKAEGYLVTVWGDGGHRQIWPASLAGIAEAAHRSWSGTAHAYEPRAAGLFAFNNPAMGPWLDELGSLDRSLRDGSRWQTTYTALHAGVERHPDIPWAYTGPAVKPGITAPSEWEAIVIRAYELKNRMPSNIDPDLAEECQLSITLITLGAERGIEASGGADRPQDWDKRLNEAIEAYQKCWLRRSRNSSLADSCTAFRSKLG
jgi:hypothetical protein